MEIKFIIKTIWPHQEEYFSQETGWTQSSHRARKFDSYPEAEIFLRDKLSSEVKPTTYFQIDKIFILN